MENRKLVRSYLNSSMLKELTDNFIVDEVFAEELLDDMVASAALPRNPTMGILEPEVVDYYLNTGFMNFLHEQEELLAEYYFILHNFYFFQYEKGHLTSENYLAICITLQKDLDVRGKALSYHQFTGEEYLPFHMLGKDELSRKDSSKKEVIHKQNVVPFKKHPEYYKVRIDIVGEKPPIWQRIILSGDTTFEQFSNYLKAIYDFPLDVETSYLFQIDNRFYIYDPTLLEFKQSGGEIYDSRKTLVIDWKDQPVSFFSFDQNDEETRLKIQVEEAIPLSSLPDGENEVPICLKAKGNIKVGWVEESENGVVSEVSAINERLKKLENR